MYNFTQEQFALAVKNALAKEGEAAIDHVLTDALNDLETDRSKATGPSRLDYWRIWNP